MGFKYYVGASTGDARIPTCGTGGPPLNFIPSFSDDEDDYPVWKPPVKECKYCGNEYPLDKFKCETCGARLSR